MDVAEVGGVVVDATDAAGIVDVDVEEDDVVVEELRIGDEGAAKMLLLLLLLFDAIEETAADAEDENEEAATEDADEEEEDDGIEKLELVESCERDEAEIHPLKFVVIGGGTWLLEIVEETPPMPALVIEAFPLLLLLFTDFFVALV